MTTEDPITALTSMLAPGRHLHRDWTVDSSIEVATIDGWMVSDSPISPRSTHPISRLRLTLTNGQQVTAIFKRLRPQPGKDVCREVLTYRRLLSNGHLGAPDLYASVCDQAQQRYWLLLEDVGERALSRCGVNDRVEAVRWAARMHATYHGRTAELRALECLGEHGPQFYHALASAARLRLNRCAERPALDRFNRLMARLDRTVEFLDAQPRTLIHGDLSDANLFIQYNSRSRIRPIDWEWAAIGLSAWDLDKLLVGDISTRAQLRAAYINEFVDHAGVSLDAHIFEIVLTHCAIVRALWNLGCPSPPPKGVGWDGVGINRLLDQIAELQEHISD